LAAPMLGRPTKRSDRCTRQKRPGRRGGVGHASGPPGGASSVPAADVTFGELSDARRGGRGPCCSGSGHGSGLHGGANPC
jgi:hypothetical protein